MVARLDVPGLRNSCFLATFGASLAGLTGLGLNRLRNIFSGLVASNCIRGTLSLVFALNSGDKTSSRISNLPFRVRYPVPSSPACTLES